MLMPLFRVGCCQNCFENKICGGWLEDKVICAKVPVRSFLYSLIYKFIQVYLFRFFSFL